MINTFGGEWFNLKWEPQLTSPATKKAVNFYVDLIRKYGEPGATSSGFTECETAMAQGKTAMWVDATVAAGQLTDPSKSQVAKDIGFAYAPTAVTPNGSHWLWAWSLAMEASSKNKDAAFKFLTWATSKSYIKLVAGKNGWGSVPPGTRISTYSNPNYKKAAGAFEGIVRSVVRREVGDDALRAVERFRPVLLLHREAREHVEQRRHRGRAHGGERRRF